MNIKQGYPKSLIELKRFFKSMGIQEKIAKGRGYFYFYDGDASSWYESSVSVYDVDDLSYEQWYNEYLSLSKKTYENKNLTKIKNMIREEIKALLNEV